MAKRQGMRFVTEKERNKTKVKQFIFGFVAFLLVFAVISVAYIFKAYHLTLDDFKSEETTIEEDSSETLVDTVPLEGEATFLLAGMNDEKTDIYFMLAVKADLDSKEIRVLPIPKTQTATVDGKKDTILNHYRNTSVKGLLSAVNNALGFNVDRYILSTRGSFKSAINSLGGADLVIEKRIDYKSKAFNLSLVPGEQNIKGETLLEYIRYAGMKQGVNVQAQIICDLIKQFMSPSFLAAGREHFSELVNSLTSDITIVDFTKNKKLLLSVADAEDSVKYKVVTSVEELK